MPELPDVELYLDALRDYFQDATLEQVVIKSPFLLRSYDIDISEVEGARVNEFSRIGKRIVWHLSDELFLVFHLMISGRFHLRRQKAMPRSKMDLAAFQFASQTLMLTEAASKKRASLHIIRGQAGLAEFQRGGLNIFDCTQEDFAKRLRETNRTVKIALIDPTTFDGIGNAYSDEILHHARLSPFQRTSKLSDQQIKQLLSSARETLATWIERLQQQRGDRFPEKVTAFRPEMAVHGKFGEPCPDCDRPVQRIAFADKEWNYCAQCQTGGRLLADRSLSTLLRDEWPKHIDELAND